MKKNFLVFILVAISFLLLGQKEKDLVTFSVEPETNFKFVSQEFKGSVNQIEGFMKEFMKNFFDQQLIPNGQPMAIFHNEPKSAEDQDLKFEIGFPVGTRDDVKVKSPLKVRDIELPTVVKHVHTGPYQELFGVYEKLKGVARQNDSDLWGKGFTIHRFLNNPEYVKPEEIKTEVIVPVKETSRLTTSKKPLLKIGESVHYTVMYKSYQGSVDQIGEFVQDFLKEFFSENRTPMGQPMVIFANAPRGSKDKDLKMDIGIPISEKDKDLLSPKGTVPIKGREIKPATTEKHPHSTEPGDVRIPKGGKSALKIKTVHMDNVAKQEHIGPYEKLFEVHREMLQETKRQNFQVSETQAILILLNNPTLVKPEEIRAKIIIPAGK